MTKVAVPIHLIGTIDSFTHTFINLFIRSFNLAFDTYFKYTPYSNMPREKSQRRALNPLSINAMAPTLRSSKDGKVTRKRRADEVEDFELQRRVTRMCIASQRTPTNQECLPVIADLVKEVFVFVLRFGPSSHLS